VVVDAIFLKALMWNYVEIRGNMWNLDEKLMGFPAGKVGALKGE
jgi:hypothetical protein